MTRRRASISPDRHPLSGAEEAAFFDAAANEAERVTTRSRDDDRISSHARVRRFLTVRQPPTRRPLSSPAAPSRARRSRRPPGRQPGRAPGRPPPRPHPRSRASRSPAEREAARVHLPSRASASPSPRCSLPSLPRPPSPSPSSYLTSTSREDVEDVEGARPPLPSRNLLNPRGRSSSFDRFEESFPRSTSTFSRSSSRLSRARTSARSNSRQLTRTRRRLAPSGATRPFATRPHGTPPFTSAPPPPSPRIDAGSSFCSIRAVM